MTTAYRYARRRPYTKTCRSCGTSGLTWGKRPAPGGQWRLRTSDGALHRCSVNPLPEHTEEVTASSIADDDFDTYPRLTCPSDQIRISSTPPGFGGVWMGSKPPLTILREQRENPRPWDALTEWERHVMMNPERYRPQDRVLPPTLDPVDLTPALRGLGLACVVFGAPLGIVAWLLV